MNQTLAEADASTRDARAAVDKAICLLTAFGDDAHSGVGVSELARRANMSKSTAFRVLGMLSRNGVVHKVGPNYRLGRELIALAGPTESPRNTAIRDALTPFLADLYEHTHHTVHLAVIQGADVVYLNKLYGHRTVPAPSRVGGRVPANCTGVGKALLAYDPAAEEIFTGEVLRALTPLSITDQERFGAELARVRLDGVAHDRGEVLPGLACIAAPIMVRGRALAAMSVSGHINHFDPSQVEAVLRRVCHAAGTRLSTQGQNRTKPRITALSA